MEYPILVWPSPILSEVAKPFVWSEHKEESVRYLDKLVLVMEAAMVKARGVGLAAPQIGVSERVIIAVDPNRPQIPAQVLVNPEIVNQTIEIDSKREGCLSLPGEHFNVLRFKHVKVKFQHMDGREAELDAEGFFAIELQHEIDHLNGKLLVDSVSPLQRTLIRDRMRLFQKKQRRSGDTWKDLDELGTKLLTTLKAVS